jgi:hypothetical protein
MEAVFHICLGVLLLFLVFATLILIGLATRRTEEDECYDSEWESGSVDVRRFNKAQSDIDTDRMRNEFNDESG